MQGERDKRRGAISQRQSVRQRHHCHPDINTPRQGSKNRSHRRSCPPFPHILSLSLFLSRGRQQSSELISRREVLCAGIEGASNFTQGEEEAERRQCSQEPSHGCLRYARAEGPDHASAAMQKMGCIFHQTSHFATVSSTSSSAVLVDLHLGRSSRTGENHGLRQQPDTTNLPDLRESKCSGRGCGVGRARSLHAQSLTRNNPYTE